MSFSLLKSKIQEHQVQRVGRSKVRGGAQRAKLAGIQAEVKANRFEVDQGQGQKMNQGWQGVEKAESAVIRLARIRP